MTSPLIRLSAALASLLLTPSAFAQYGKSTYEVPPGMVKGGAFIDRFLPMKPNGPLRKDVWGVDGVKPRDVANGVEDAEYSYWCTSVVKGPEGKYHNFVVRWREDSPKGHFQWPNSIVVHAVGDTPTGPFKVVSEIGKGHNVVAYQAKDGTWILYVIGACYRSPSLDGPWVRGKLEFDNRGRKSTNMSNCDFTRRKDGSFLMVSRTGETWVSRDGNKEPFRRISNRSAYPEVSQARFEDPVMWKDDVQYNLIVNDWFGRVAYYLRSRDGLHWNWDQGRAYGPGIFKHEDGTLEDWHKIERPRVLQDQNGRATHLFFAVIDDEKELDKPKDNHSSKAIGIGLNVQKTMRVAKEEGRYIVTLEAGPDFDPTTAKDLRFGAPAAVDFGKAPAPIKSGRSGSSLVAEFDAAACGFQTGDPVGKLLATDKNGKLVYAYAAQPGEPAEYPVLSAHGSVKMERAAGGALAVKVQFENFGLAASKPMPASVKLIPKKADTIQAVGTIPALEPYGSSEVEFKIPSAPGGEVAELEITIGSGAKEDVLKVDLPKLP